MKKIKYLLFGIMTMLVSMPVVFAGTEYIECGNSSIPAPIPGITRVVVLLLQILLPLVVIVMGSLDFLKAVSTSDSEKIKNGQKQFIKRIVAAGLFFIVITVTKFVVDVAADINDEGGSISSCIDCLISDKDACGEIKTSGPFSVN